MARQEVIDYIRRYSGEFQDDSLREKLAAGGCTQQEIDEAFAQARGTAPQELPEALSAVPAAAEEEGPGTLALVIGIGLILASFLPLIFGGVLMGPSLNMLLVGKQFSAKALLSGILLGGVGAGLMLGGATLCGARKAGAARVKPWKVLLFGLCFPGAAQAYGGRWLPCAFFLLLPWALITLVIIGATLYGAAAARFGFQAGTIFSAIATMVMPSKPFYALLWIGSLAEGWHWADSLPQDDTGRRIPGWPAPVLGLGAISYLFVFFLMLVTTFVGISLKAGIALKGGVQDAKTQSAPGTPGTEQPR